MLQAKLSQTLRGRIGVGLIRHQYANGRFQIAVLQFRRHSLRQKLSKIPRLAAKRPFFSGVWLVQELEAKSATRFLVLEATLCLRPPLFGATKMTRPQ